MNKTMIPILGLFMMLLSVFFLMGGLYLEAAGLPSFLSPVCLAVGLGLLAAGLLLYHVVKNGDE